VVWHPLEFFAKPNVVGLQVQCACALVANQKNAASDGCQC